MWVGLGCRQHVSANHGFLSHHAAAATRHTCVCASCRRVWCGPTSITRMQVGRLLVGDQVHATVEGLAPCDFTVGKAVAHYNAATGTPPSPPPPRARALASVCTAAQTLHRLDRTIAMPAQACMRVRACVCLRA
jgi:hypothetical protein